MIVSSTLSQTVGATTAIDIWLRRNGTDLVNSNRRNTVETSGSVQVLTQSYIVQVTANQFIEIFQAVSNTIDSPGIYSFSPAGRPVVPSITVTINFIST